MTARGEPRRLFCWSGGGLPGLDIHVGLWLALERAGIHAAAHAGTSAGAIIAAFAAQGYSAEEARDILHDLRDRDVRRERFAWKMRVPCISHFLTPEPIQALLSKHLAGLFSDCLSPLSVHVTRNRDGRGVAFTSGSVPRAVMASMSISGVWPAVQIGEETYSDGGTTANVPLPVDASEFDEIWLMVASRPLAYRRRGGSMISRLMYSVDLLMERQLHQAVTTAQAMCSSVKVLRPPVRVPGGALHFDHALTAEAFAWASGTLEAGAL